ncbi:nucleotidyltransferase domain-containing protein [Streptomyces sp. NPDC059597]|uniref:nucleotidyltransferase domain-containing protein n=1 Tax=Streptomyces sp. NPDC059597 TaxID=3346879 RepID=UPI0036C3FA90
MELVEIARRLVGERHPGARAAFLGGSVVTERRTAMSDLDVVVLLDGEPAPYRVSLRWSGWPVELFAHTEASWEAYVGREVRRGRSPLLFMCAEGELLFDVDGVGMRIAAEARELVDAGPPAVSREEVDDLRYALTDLLDDLAGSGDRAERLFIATELARRSGELALVVRRSWRGGGKWLARRLEVAVPGLGDRLGRGVREVLDGRDELLVSVVDEVLGEVGGRLWVGYRRGGAA